MYTLFDLKVATTAGQFDIIVVVGPPLVILTWLSRGNIPGQSIVESLAPAIGLRCRVLQCVAVCCSVWQ